MLRLISRRMLKTAKIQLTDQEQSICRLLVDVTKHLRVKNSQLPAVTLRVAGGWVRDKLLNRPSHDIDVALDSMMGYDFASHVQEYVTNTLKDPSIIGHVAKIKSNPDKSKHLETATVRIHGLDIDFVNLRNEVYTEGSRIPQIVFGTPEEDASRRDLTINSMFYNLHTEQVEDFLGTGLDDLRNQVIRTPLPAFETFKDDPLRILRAIRFASRFGYRVVTDIKVAVQNQEIKDALKTTISRERVGDEIRKMMEGPRPILAIEYLYHFGIFDIVFSVPDQLCPSYPPTIENSVRLVKAVDWFLHTPSQLKSQLNETLFQGEAKKLLLLAATLSPYSHMTYLEKVGSKKVETAAILYVAKQSLKFPNSDSEVISRLNDLVDVVRSSARKYHHAQTLDKSARLELGSLVRRLGSKPLGNLYPLAIAFSAIQDMSWKMIQACPEEHGDVTHVEPERLSHPTDRELFDGDFEDMHHDQQVLPSQETIDVIFKPYSGLLDAVRKLGVQDAHEMRPLMDGKEIIAYLGEYYAKKGDSRRVNPGRWLGSAIDKLIEWQLAEDSAQSHLTKSDCQKHLEHLVKTGVIQPS